MSTGSAEGEMTSSAVKERWQAVLWGEMASSAVGRDDRQCCWREIAGGTVGEI
jgi:hypothetical protein